MTAEVASYPRMDPYRGGRGTDPRGSIGSTFSYSSQPRPLYYDSYKNLSESAKPLYGNIMYDKRVIHGNSWALRRMAADAVSRTSAEERKQMQERRRQIRQRVQSKLSSSGSSSNGSSDGGSNGAIDGSRRRKQVPLLGNHGDANDTRGLSVSPGVAKMRGSNGKKMKIGSVGVQASPPLKDSPPLTTRISSPILEEEPNAEDDKQQLYSSSGDSGIHLHDNSTSSRAPSDFEMRTSTTITPQIQVEAQNDDEHDEHEESNERMIESEDQSIDTDHLVPTHQLQVGDADVFKEHEKEKMEALGHEEAAKEDNEKPHVKNQADLDEPMETAATESIQKPNGASGWDLDELHLACQEVLEEIFDRTLTLIISKSRSIDQSHNRDNRDNRELLKSKMPSTSNNNSNEDEFIKSPYKPNDYLRGPILSPIEESMFSPVIPSSAQTLVADLMERSIRRVEVLSASSAGQPLASNAKLGGYNPTDPDGFVDHMESLKDEVDFTIIDYCRRLIDQLVDGAIDRVVIAFTEEMSKGTGQKPTIQHDSERLVENLLDTSVKRVIDRSLTEALGELDQEDRLIKAAWLIEESVEKEWLDQLKELEESMAAQRALDAEKDTSDRSDKISVPTNARKTSDRAFLVDPAEFEREVLARNRSTDTGAATPINHHHQPPHKSTDPGHAHAGDHASTAAVKPLEGQSFAMDIVTSVDGLTDLLARADLDNRGIDASLISDISRQLRELRQRAMMEEKQTAQLVGSYQTAVEEANKYMCRSIAQEYVGTLFNNSIDQIDFPSTHPLDNTSVLEGDGGIRGGGANQEDKKRALFNEAMKFSRENAIFAFEDMSGGIGQQQQDDDATGDLGDLQKKLARQVMNDVKKDLEPWIYGKAYAEVAREMTNLWLRDATNGRSQYCRCSAQRPLRRLLQEVEDLDKHP